MPAVLRRNGNRSQGFGGHWMNALHELLSKQPDIELAVGCAFPELKTETFDEDGIKYLVVGQPRRYSPFRARQDDIHLCADFVNDFKPDVVHVHGSERFYGMLSARRLVCVPFAISLQGILGPYANYRNFFGDLSPQMVFNATRLAEIPLRLGLLWQYRDLKGAALRELETMIGARHFFGRTKWDRAHARALNPSAGYFEVGEIMRSEFYAPEWSLTGCHRHTIVHVNAGHPRKGTETLIRAVRLLKCVFPDIRLRIVGAVSSRSGYGRFLRRYIHDNNVGENVEMIGYLEAGAIVDELLKAHAFVLPSYIDNSPNSLAEAMLVGIPCVASFVGGVPSMIDEGETGFLFPAGDEALLADSIRRVFLEDALAVGIGFRARQVALVRHAPDRILVQLINAYRTIAGLAQVKRSN